VSRSAKAPVGDIEVCTSTVVGPLAADCNPDRTQAHTPGADDVGNRDIACHPTTK
jgi:hypothetical protein